MKLKTRTVWKTTLGIFVWVSLCAALSAPAAEFGLRGWAVRGGTILPSGWDAGLTVGGSLNVGEIMDGLYLLPSLNYFQAERDFVLSSTLEATGFSAGAEVRYYLDREVEGFYFGGGPYLTDFSYAGAARPLRPNGPDSLALSGVAGYRWGSWLAEARYTSLSGFSSAQLLMGFGFGGN